MNAKELDEEIAGQTVVAVESSTLPGYLMIVLSNDSDRFFLTVKVESLVGAYYTPTDKEARAKAEAEAKKLWESGFQCEEA